MEVEAETKVDVVADVSVKQEVYVEMEQEVGLSC